jgi:hypothetical protein
MKLHYKLVDHGFEWGPAKINRFFSDSKRGWVWVKILTKKKPIFKIYVTKSGKVRIFKDDKEMK